MPWRRTSRRTLAGVAPHASRTPIGCGPVGLLAVRAALDRGAREVVALDRVTSRLEVAKRFGATPFPVGGPEASAFVRDRTEGRGADRVILPLTDGVVAHQRLNAREEGMAKVVLVP